MCKLKYQLTILGLALVIFSKLDMVLEKESFLTIVVSLIGFGYIVAGFIAGFKDE